MKKLICLLLALVSVMSLVACGSYTEGTTAVRESTTVVDPGDVDPNDELTSTVTLSLDGRPIMENAGFYMMFMGIGAMVVVALLFLANHRAYDD